VAAPALVRSLFAFYLVSYGVFRFFTEYLRETPKAYGGLSAYQIMSLAR
jgi:prolipoprotein diacylglyceryltransferase